MGIACGAGCYKGENGGKCGEKWCFFTFLVLCGVIYGGVYGLYESSHHIDTTHQITKNIFLFFSFFLIYLFYKSVYML